MLRYIVLLAFLPEVIHGLPGVPECSSINLLTAVDFGRMGGDWYLAYRHSSPYDRSKCIKHSIVDLGFVQLITTTYSSTLNVKSTTMGGSIRFGTTQYVTFYPFSQIPFFVPYSLFSTDYTSYAVIYFCQYWGYTTFKVLHIYVRDKNNPTPGVTKAYADLNKGYVYTEGMEAVDQTCL